MQRIHATEAAFRRQDCAFMISRWQKSILHEKLHRSNGRSGLGSFFGGPFDSFLGLDEYGDVTEAHRFPQTLKMPPNCPKMHSEAIKKIRVPKLENDEKQNFTKLSHNVHRVS